MSAEVRCHRLVHVYGSQGQQVTALRGVDLEVQPGETVALLGPSGAGKSTLLWILAGLTRPTAGVAEVCGRNLLALSPADAADLRRQNVGIVLQNPTRNILPYETAMGNVLFAQRSVRGGVRGAGRRAMDLLDAVGLAASADRTSGRMSGGEQQRLALAVALANKPRLLLADEPTSQLDRDSGRAVLELIGVANREYGTTVVAVTHDPAVGTSLGRTITIRDGRVGSEGLAGEEYLVVGSDGTIQLPEDLLEVFPAGTLMTARRSADGVELRRAATPSGPE